MHESKTPLAAFTTNSFVGNPYAIIIMGFLAGMFLMSAGIMAGMPVIVSMILLFVGILGVFGFGIGKVHYAISQSGIQQHIRRFIPFYLWGKMETRFFPWNVVGSYKNDTDRTRSGGEYEYLKLYLKKSPGEIWITNQHDDAGFQKFKAAFLSIIANPYPPFEQPKESFYHETPIPKTGEQDKPEQTAMKAKSKETAPEIPTIVRRKSFYETFFAKMITVFFTVLTIFLVWILAYKGMHFTNWFRVLYILLPGTVYMIYRVFISPKISKEHIDRYNK